jgi:hypothetical protein
VDYDALLADAHPQLLALCRFLQIPPSPRMFTIANVEAVRKKPPPPVAPELAEVADAMLVRLRTAPRLPSTGQARSAA